MTGRDLVAQNLGYAVLGGIAVGVGCGAVVYGLGWALTVRRDRKPPESASGSDGERSRREDELEAEKGAHGGSGR